MTSKPAGKEMPGVRLQRVLATAGFGSRRSCEQLIAEGRVSVDGKTVTEMGTRVRPDRQKVQVDGQPVRMPLAYYYVMYKPRGVICSLAEDEQGRKSISEYLPRKMRGLLKPVGRLDVQTTGLIFLTNDGGFSDRITHPRYGVEKIYRVKVRGMFTDEQVATLKKGVMLDDGPAKASAVRVDTRTKDDAVLILTMKEGRNRIVRRMMEAMGVFVKRLTRTQIGCVTDEGLRSGMIRELTPLELSTLLGFIPEVRKASDVRNELPRGGRPAPWRKTLAKDRRKRPRPRKKGGK